MKNNNLNFWDFNTKEIRTESFEKFEKSFFKDVYEQALSGVEEIVSHVKGGVDDDKVEINNIIAFTGERGTGKTTAMMSFVNYLKRGVREDRLWKPDSLVKGFSFRCMPMIDPSKLTSDENIVTLVIAYIYESLKEIARTEGMVDRSNSGRRLSKLKDGVRKCQEIYNVVRTKYTSFSKNIEQNPDTVETFSEIAKATKLRELIQELVDEYLDILDDGNHTNQSVLIIPIDDLDTNIKNAYTLAEDLRSYFMVSKVIIMMAVKLEQLNDVMQLKFCEDFKSLSKEEQRMDTSPENMATKYLEKLISHDRRIAMPKLSLQSLENYRIEIKRVGELGEQTFATQSSLLRKRTSEMDFPTEDYPLVDFVLKLLWKKTGIILVKNDRKMHDFIPCNLRTLHQMLETLENQEDISLNEITKLRLDGKEKQLLKAQLTLQFNLDKIQSFLLDNSTSGSMDKELVVILHQLNEQPVDTINAFLVRGLWHALQNTLIGNHIQSDPVIKNFSAEGVHPYLITVGDVLYLLNSMGQSGVEMGIRQFIMSVKVIYSIIMIRLLFAYGEEPQYAAAKQLLGNTICNPAVKLLPGSKGNQTYEWMPHIRGEKLGVEIEDRIFTLDGKEEVRDSVDLVCLDTMLRMSFYVLGYHRMKRSREFRQIDPHVYESGDFPLLKYRRSASEDVNSALLAFHWISFVSLTLCPDESVDALFHCVEKVIGDEKWKGIPQFRSLMDEILEWRKKYVCAVPVYSMDVINELTLDMHEKRFEYDNGTAEDNQLHGFLYFYKSISASLEHVVTYSSVSVREDMDGIQAALRSCPVLFQTDRGIEQLDGELKWLNV